MSTRPNEFAARYFAKLIRCNGRVAARLLDEEGRRVNYKYGWIKEALPKVKAQLKAEGIDMSEEQIRRRAG
jgi:roadblock/LC7 domain-containing protein